MDCAYVSLLQLFYTSNINGTLECFIFLYRGLCDIWFVQFYLCVFFVSNTVLVLRGGLVDRKKNCGGGGADGGVRPGHHTGTIQASSATGYKSISRDLDVPVSTVRNVIKKFTTHGTVALLPGCGQKREIDERLQRRIVRMVDKEPLSSSKKIQADLQTHGTTVSARTIRRHLNVMGRYGRRPRRTPLLTQRHKKPD